MENGRSAESPRPFSLEDLAGPADRAREWRRIPGLTREALRLVWRSSRRTFLATTVLQVLAGAGIGAQILVGKMLLQGLLTVGRDGTGLDSLAPEFGALIGVTIGLGCINAFLAQQQRLLVELVGRHTFDRIVGVSSSVELQSFEDPVFFDKLTRARTSGLSKPIEMVNSLNMLTTALLATAGIGAALFTVEPLLLPLVLCAGLPLLLATLHNSRQAYAFEYAMTHHNRERMYLMQLLTAQAGAKEVRVFGAARFLRRRYDALTDERIARLRGFLRGRVRVALVGTVASSLGMALALGALAVLLVEGRIGFVDAVIAGAAMQMLSSRVTAMTMGLGKLVETGMFLDDYRSFLELAEPAEPESHATAPQPDRLRPIAPFAGLAVEGLSFEYPRTNRRVLDDVSLRVDPGEVVALVGENGSGKTTLVKLICQLYRPQAGRILWNGVNAVDLAPEEIRSDMTVIFQDFIQYHLTARDNIALGRIEHDASLADLETAARRAGAHEFLSRLPDGYDTRLGRQFYGGQELSIGQWQRLALARAFFRGGSFLVLDEPTAALDPRAEYELFSQIRALAAGRSVLLVSHRFSSVRAADRIHVLDQGRIVESGSHEELVSLNGHYAELFALHESAHLGSPARI